MNTKSQSTDERSFDAATTVASDSDETKPFEPALPKSIPGFAEFGHIPLQGVCNTRDLGGMPTSDGRHIRAHRLIRSGEPHHATQDDIATLMNEHELAAIFDLRTDIEIEHAEDPLLKMPGVDYVHMSALPDDDVISTSLAKLASNKTVVHEFRKNAFEFMKHLYHDCVMSEEGKQAYRRFFQVLLDTPEGSVLWHCTQGKDRTGIAAYLIEYVLNVSKDDRRQDYLATNLFMEGRLKNVEQHLRHAHLLEHLDLDIEAYTYASLDNLDTALEAIKESYGTLDAYLEKALGVGDEERQRLQELYLE